MSLGGGRVTPVCVCADDRVAHAQLSRGAPPRSSETQAAEKCVCRVVVGHLNHAAGGLGGAESEDLLVEGEEARLLLAVRLGKHDQLVERRRDCRPRRGCGCSAPRPLRSCTTKEMRPSKSRGLGLQLLAHLASSGRCLHCGGRREAGRRQQCGDERASMDASSAASMSGGRACFNPPGPHPRTRRFAAAVHAGPINGRHDRGS